MEWVAGALELEVRRISNEADRVVSVVLAHKDGSELPNLDCGAHIDLILTRDLIRQFSLCGDRSVRNEWTIAVLREEGGRGGSEYVHSTLKPGMVVRATGPRNNFPLVDAEQYLFIAGGIGITPLLPMVREVDAQGKDWRMLYGGRRLASMAFLDELRRFGSRVVVAPEDECGRLDLKATIDPLPADTAVYCCGPEPLIAAVEDMCAQLGRPAPHVERFAARREAPTTEDHENRAFELVLSESGMRFAIPADKTIIEVLEEEGVFVPTSCTEGFCGMCETEVVSGIPDHRDDYLTEEQRATNVCMMICVGRSKSPVLMIKR